MTRILMTAGVLGMAALCLTACPMSALADALTGQFPTSMNVVNEVGVSGMESSYYQYTRPDPFPLILVPAVMPSLGFNRVSYPDGVGAVPSPGAYSAIDARTFDEGMFGVQVKDGTLTVRVASGMDPKVGAYDGGWARWYDQGDLFVSVQDSLGVRQYALLNTWRQDANGSFLQIDDGSFNTAQAFHVGKVGALVQLATNSQVAQYGGGGAYDPTYHYVPTTTNGYGLDYRAFAQGGSVISGTDYLTLDQAAVQAPGYGGVVQNWYLETWTVPFSMFSSDQTATFGFHIAFDCGNDQIGWVGDLPSAPHVGQQVPAPAAIVLGLIGITSLGLYMRRYA
jgi:hypothetical protein